MKKQAQKKQMTTEVFRKIFLNVFDLTDFAIRMGKQAIASGEFYTLDQLLLEVKKQAQIMQKKTEV